MGLKGYLKRLFLAYHDEQNGSREVCFTTIQILERMPLIPLKWEGAGRPTPEKKVFFLALT